jgi:ribose transport system ATP-binding protein
LALQNVSLNIQPGRVLALVGENGSGKSTLMKLVAGEENLSSGAMSLEGVAFGPSSPWESRQAGIHLVRQELAICPHLSIAENLYLGTDRGFQFSAASCERNASELFSRLGYSNLDVSMRMDDCSVAVQQVVEIARCQVLGSRYVLFDEPTSSLTKPDVEKLFTLIRELKTAGCGVVYISHFLDEVAEIADDIAILRDGELVSYGEANGYKREDMIRHMVGRDLGELYPRSERIAGETLLEVQIQNSTGKLKKASLQLCAGEVVGIAGMNGSGRTELLRAIFRLDASQGQIQILGEALEQPWPQQVGMVSEDRKSEGLALSLPIFENLRLPQLGRKQSFYSPNQELAKAKSHAENTRVKCHSLNQPIGQLSGGNQQKVALARLLDMDCRVLLLDEPTRGIDVGSKAEIYALIDELAKQGRAVLMVSSYLPELLGVCDRIHVMNQGELLPAVEAGTTDQEALMEMCVQK